MYEGENYEDYVQVGYQDECDIITVSADVCEYIDYPDECVDFLKCDAYCEE